MRSFLLSVALFFLPSVANADVIVSVAGMATYGNYGDPINSVRFFNATPNAVVTDISWEDVAIFANDPSWLSEVVFSFSDSTGADFWEFTVAPLDQPGFFIGSGEVSSVVLSSGGPFQLQNDGLIRLEVFEAFTDGGTPDAIITGGTFNLTVVPEPAVFGPLAGLICLVAARRSRRAV